MCTIRPIILELTFTYFLGLISPFAETVWVRSCRTTRPDCTAITPRFRANMLYPTPEEITTTTRTAIRIFFFVVITVPYTNQAALKFRIRHDNRSVTLLKNHVAR